MLLQILSVTKFVCMFNTVLLSKDDCTLCPAW